MRVLLTGASSFTGAWFARALAAAGADVTAACRAGLEAGQDMRRRRLAMLAGRVELVGDCAFGSAGFLDLVRGRGPFDLLCHHAAEVGDHRSAEFEVAPALAANCRGIADVLDTLEAQGCRAVLLTGSVFEADEGRGSRPLRAFSPYGLAKTLTWHTWRFHAERRGLVLGKFVVPAPYGPLEKPCFASHLVGGWLAGETVRVLRPELVRDHVPVAGLAAAYAAFAERLPDAHGTVRCAPSLYAESLACFARRLARELEPRLARPCRLSLAEPPPTSDEPVHRVNTEPLTDLAPGFEVAADWDSYVLWWIGRDDRTIIS